MSADSAAECRADAFLPAVLAVVTAACFVALAVATALHPGPFWIDSSVLADLRADRSPHLTEFARAVTTAGSPPATTIALCAAASLLAWRRRSVVALVLAIAAILSTGAADSTAKRLVARPRPPMSVRVPHVSAGGMSFPSGHTTDAVVFLVLPALLLAVGSRRRRVLYLSGASVAVALVGWSRMYLGVHYATDIAGSLLLGTSLVAALTAVSRRWSLKSVPHTLRSRASPRGRSSGGYGSGTSVVRESSIASAVGLIWSSCRSSCGRPAAATASRQPSARIGVEGP